MDIDQIRRDEAAKYTVAYETNDYRMGLARKMSATDQLIRAPSRASYLDVGCGRGEMLNHARTIGFKRIEGTETVLQLLDRPDVRLAFAHCLPYAGGEFDIVSCFDVLEHIIPQDTAQILREINRVARLQVILTANNMPSTMNGVDLHINIKPYKEWDRLIRTHITGWVEWVPRRPGNISETWVVTK